MTIRYDFSGKVALVTGAASGIGRATALAFGDAGAQVVVADIDEQGGTNTADAIRAAGGKAQSVRVDVADEQAVLDMVESIVAQFGKIDIAHNNAGIEADIVPLAELSSSNWRRVMEVNLSSVYYCLKAEIPAMLRNGGGAIVNTASASGLIAGYRLACYTASKHGVIGLTKAAAVDYGDKGIRINALCPGPVDTPFIANLPPPMKERLLFGTPIGRLSTAEELARSVLWLCSDDSRYVVGHALSVDGGVSLGATGTRMEDLW